MSRFMNASAGGSASTGSDAVDYSDSGLPLTFCMKQNIGLDVPLDVIEAIAVFRPLRTFREAYRGSLRSSIRRGRRRRQFVVKCTKENTPPTATSSSRRSTSFEGVGVLLTRRTCTRWWIALWPFLLRTSSSRDIFRSGLFGSCRLLLVFRSEFANINVLFQSQREIFFFSPL